MLKHWTDIPELLLVCTLTGLAWSVSFPSSDSPLSLPNFSEFQVTGSSDRTLRQWDLQTGRCVLTMDILWAISNPLASQTLSSDPEEMYSSEDPYATPTSSPRKSLGALRRQSSSFMPSNAGGFAPSPTTTTYADGSWEMYEDFVGGVQFWGYALASGTGDGCVRMWDSEFFTYHSA